MRKTIYISVCLALFSFIMHSCSDWLDVQPMDRQTETQTFGSKNGFYSAINGIYTKLNSKNSYGGHLSYDMVEILAKRYMIASSTNKVGTAFQAYSYADENTIPVIENIWETNYNIILNCNIVLKNVELQKNILTEKDYSIIKGEMLALRAFIHFDLLRLFGPIYKLNPDHKAIPYNTSYDGTVAPILSAKEILFDNILVDIKDAEVLLKNYDPVLKDGPRSEDIESDIEIYSDDNLYKYRQLRFNYFALMTLKARVELYAGENTTALTTAKSVILSEEVIKFFPPISSSLIIGNNSNPDRMFTSEVFFGMYDKERNLLNKNSFDPETAGGNLLQPRKDYIDNMLFSDMPADYRLKGQWVTPNSSSNTNKTLGKYKDIQNKLLFYATFVPLIRLSELYLIAAETEPNVADGLAHLNRLRVDMRGNIGSPLTGITTSAALDTEIMKEYTREFYGEGQLFYYYKRKNINIPGTNNGNNSSTVWSGSSSKYYVLPLPESETTPR